MKVSKSRASSIRQAPFYFYLVVVCALLAGGCQRSAYRASKLPPELQAPPNVNAQSLDLSKLGVSTSSTELIQTGDLLDVTVATGLENPQEQETKWPLRVADDGSVSVPLVGRVFLAGLPLSQADHVIRQASIERGMFRNPNVAVLVAKPRTNKISVIGAVLEPGTYELPVANSDFLSAISAAGGLAENADTVVEIRHPPRVSRDRNLLDRNPEGVTTAAFRSASGASAARTQRIDLVSATAGEPANYQLEDGTVVMVMKRPLRAVYVTGLVQDPNQYEMPTDTDLFLLDAISMAGGKKLEFADQITVIRRGTGDTEPVVIKASYREATRNQGANLRLAAGDVVKVDETPLTFTVQTMKDLFRFGFSSALPLF